MNSAIGACGLKENLMQSTPLCQVLHVGFLNPRASSKARLHFKPRISAWLHCHYTGPAWAVWLPKKQNLFWNNQCWTPETPTSGIHLIFFFLPHFCRRISCAEYVVVFTPRKSHLLSGPNDSLCSECYCKFQHSSTPYPPPLGFLNCSALISEATGELCPEFQLLCWK